MIDHQQLESLITKHGLTGPRDEILRAALPSLRLLPVPLRSEDDIAIGATKIGGTPDFPPGMEYPYETGIPLRFVAQVNLSQVRALIETHPLLPQTGILYFFYEDDLPPIAPEDRSHWIPWLARVMFYDGDLAALQRAEAPPDLAHAPYKGCRVEFEEDLTLPPFESFFAARTLSVSWKEAVADDPVAHGYIRLVSELETARGVPVHRFMGHPDLVQGDVFRAAELRPGWEQTGIPVYDRPHFAEWMLILQIDSEDDAGMMWGDVGRLYFCIKRSDWEHKRFDKVVCEMQCS